MWDSVYCFIKKSEIFCDKKISLHKKDRQKDQLDNEVYKIKCNKIPTNNNNSCYIICPQPWLMIKKIKCKLKYEY